MAKKGNRSQYIMHTVGFGDTIQSIGDLYGVKWTDIVSLNGLEYPYIDDTISDNDYRYVDTVAKVGTRLLIPMPGINIPVKTNGTDIEIEKYAFGCDLDIFTEVLSEHETANLEDVGYLTDSNRDIKISEGLANLRQQLIIRLGTPRGALLLHPEFGSRIWGFIGRKVTPELLIDLKLEVQECILGDFRVEGVSDITAQFSDTSIRIECKVHPIAPYSSPFLLDYKFTG